MATGAANNEDFRVSKLFNVSKCTAVDTGGGTGNGLMITQTLVAGGAKVYITGCRKEAFETVVQKYNTCPGKILALPADISEKEEVLRLANEVNEPVHLLVNNAGIASDDNTKYSNGKPDFKAIRPIHLRPPYEIIPRNMGITVLHQLNISILRRSRFSLLLAKAKQIMAGVSPSIVNITSILGVMKGSSNGQFAYASSKATFLHLTRMMATTFVEAKIRVNSIAPGVFLSEMTSGDSNEHQKSELGNEASSPSGRFGHDTDMGACVLFLVGPHGTFLNGQCVYPDGGNILMSPACT